MVRPKIQGSGLKRPGLCRQRRNTSPSGSGQGLGGQNHLAHVLPLTFQLWPWVSRSPSLSPSFSLGGNNSDNWSSNNTAQSSHEREMNPCLQEREQRRQIAPRVRSMGVVMLLILRFSDTSSSYLENNRVEGSDQKIPASLTFIK